MIVDLSDARLHPTAKAQPQRKIAAPGFQIESKKTKRLAASNISMRQALNC